MDKEVLRVAWTQIANFLLFLRMEQYIEDVTYKAMYTNIETLKCTWDND